MQPRPRAGQPRWAGVLLLAMAGVPEALPGATDLSWDRPAGVRELVTEAARFGPFAAQVAADVEQALAAPTAPAGETLVRLLSLRVHLGLYLGCDARALVAATRIRETVTPPLERPFSGLLTEAMVVARAAAPAGPSSPEYARALRDALASRLAALPATPEIRAVVARQRERVHALTSSALLAEAVRLGHELDKADRWTLADVDEVARVGHRLATILPVREVLLAEFDAALGRRGRAGSEASALTPPPASTVR